MSIYLMVDFGSTYTKLTAVDIIRKEIIGTSNHYTTVQKDIREGYHNALERLKQKIGEVQFDKIIACSSAAGGLKMVAIGLVEELTVEAAKRVCLGAGGKVEHVYSHHLTKKEIDEIKKLKIDIILLAGGTDGGNAECVLHNAKMLINAKLNIPIVFAGNKDCQDEIDSLFQEAGIEGYICDNVMPRLNVLNIHSAKDVIRNIFMNHIIESKGIKRIEEEIDEVILPTPQAVLQAAELLSSGYLEEEGLGEIVLVDVGGATTDVYSIGDGAPKRADVILRGLEEPFAKRTVEGDLGMRYSAKGVVNSLTEEEIKRYLKQKMDLVKAAEKRSDDVEMIAEDDYEKQLDREIAKICISKGFSRHCGKLEQIYTPLGVFYHQVGKDLTKVNYVIGTGGIIIHNDDPRELLQEVCSTAKKPMELRPLDPVFCIDQEYILSAMGLLSLTHPEVAIHIMKKKLRVME